MTLLATAGTAAAILTAAVISGFSQGAARNGVSAWTADKSPPNERGAALSTSSMGFDFGVSIGSFVLAALVPVFGVSAGFLTSAAVVFAGSAVAYFLLRDVRHRA
jgi:predicted MFS family arabinose efflux permease